MTHKTQRAEDAASGAPLARHMKEDPRKRGVPLFLQAQNRRPLPKALQDRLDASQKKATDSEHERRDWRKPKGISWEQWDVIQGREEAERIARRDEALTRLHEREAAKPKVPKLPGYKGHLAGSRKGRVHECYDVEGMDKALKLAAKLGLKDGTAFAWIKAWAKAEPAKAKQQQLAPTPVKVKVKPAPVKKVRAKK